MVSKKRLKLLSSKYLIRMEFWHNQNYLCHDSEPNEQ